MAESFAQRLGELVGAAGGLISAAYACKAVGSLFGIHAFDEFRNAFCVAVASADELDVCHFPVVADFKVYEARAGSVGCVCQFHSVCIGVVVLAGKRRG